MEWKVERTEMEVEEIRAQGSGVKCMREKGAGGVWAWFLGGGAQWGGKPRRGGAGFSRKNTGYLGTRWVSEVSELPTQVAG